MTTIPLYEEDSYQKEFTAKVIEILDEENFILDQTCFYPVGGGQVPDNGEIFVEGREEPLHINYSNKIERGIVHSTVVEHNLKVGDKVKGVLDWNRRYILMRSHTAMHIIAAILEKEFDTSISGNNVGENKSRIDLTLEKFDRDALTNAITKANEIVKQNLDVTIRVVERSKIKEDDNVFKLLKGFPDYISIVRILSIGEFDRQACGGTHVKNTSEIGEIELINLENRGKNKRRIYFKVK